MRLENGGLVGLQPGAHPAQLFAAAVRLAASYRARCSPALPPCPAHGGAGTNGSSAVQRPRGHAARDACSVVDHHITCLRVAHLENAPCTPQTAYQAIIPDTRVSIFSIIICKRKDVHLYQTFCACVTEFFTLSNSGLQNCMAFRFLSTAKRISSSMFRPSMVSKSITSPKFTPVTR